MKQLLVIIILLNAIAISISCQKKIESGLSTCIHDTLNIKKIGIEDALLKIEEESVGFVSMRDLRKSKSFLVLFDSPLLYQNDILKMIVSEKFTLTQKVWMVESQCKCDEVYYHFCYTIIGLYKTGKLGKESEKIMVELLAPANSSTLPFLKSENIKFQLLLNDLKKGVTLPADLSSFISDIETGYVLKNWSLYY